MLTRDLFAVANLLIWYIPLGLFAFKMRLSAPSLEDSRRHSALHRARHSADTGDVLLYYITDHDFCCFVSLSARRRYNTINLLLQCIAK